MLHATLRRHVLLIGTKSNRSAIGARVIVHTDRHQQMQEVRRGGGYISQSDFRLHFGLGSAARVDSLEVRWPSGAVKAAGCSRQSHRAGVRSFDLIPEIEAIKLIVRHDEWAENDPT